MIMGIRLQATGSGAGEEARQPGAEQPGAGSPVSGCSGQASVGASLSKNDSSKSLGAVRGGEHAARRVDPHRLDTGRNQKRRTR